MGWGQILFLVPIRTGAALRLPVDFGYFLCYWQRTDIIFGQLLQEIACKEPLNNTLCFSFYHYLAMVTTATFESCSRRIFARSRKGVNTSVSLQDTYIIFTCPYVIKRFCVLWGSDGSETVKTRKIFASLIDHKRHSSVCLSLWRVVSELAG